MPVLFFDSSAVIKRYLRERGSGWVLSLVPPRAANTVVLARIAGVEVVSAIRRQERGGNVSPADAAAAIRQFEHDFANEYRIIEITVGLVSRAMSLADRYALRGYDAVQLAAAIEVLGVCRSTGIAGPTLVSADQALNAAAAAEGLLVEDPNAHP
ncbi:MAG: type II toxin-antitoxin system VapC family toxin [Planctomycetes bacterium]|nr:type II toxin-antitoxin system VapC family toxin [Planctomycetota bacterium]